MLASEKLTCWEDTYCGDKDVCWYGCVDTLGSTRLGMRIRDNVARNNPCGKQDERSETEMVWACVEEVCWCPNSKVWEVGFKEHMEG